MQRRVFVGSLVKSTLCYLPLAGGIAKAGAKTMRQRYCGTFILFSTRSEPNSSFLDKLAPYLDASNPQWRSRLLVRDTNSQEAKIFGFGSAKEPILVRIPEFLEFTPEVEVWTLDWLAFADRDDEECYPVSGGWWSVDGDWNPTKRKVRDHLFTSPNHTEGEFEEWFLDQLTRPELQSLHSDHHREMINDGEVHWDYVNVECPAVSDEPDHI